MIHARSHNIYLTRVFGWFVGAFLVSTFAVFGALGQQRDAGEIRDAEITPEVSIEIIGGDSLAVDPGAVVTVVYRIAAQEDTALLLTPDFDIPDDWSIVFGSQDVELAGSQPVTRFVTYKVPEIERAGSYSPTMTLRDASGYEMGKASSKVVVNPIHNLSMESGRVPSYLAAGRSFEMPLIVANDGNAPISVLLKKPTHKIASVDISSQSITLQPGEHTEVTASISTDADAQRSQRVILRFDGHVTNEPDIKANVSISFDIVPVFAKMRPKAANTPLSLSVETVGDESGASPQASIHASGKLMGGDVRVAAVLAETPRRHLYGQEPQVTVQYVRNNVALTVGDHSTSTSPMTLTGERGVGMAAEYQGEEWKVKTSLQRSRTVVPVQERAVVSAAYQASERTQYSANLLHRNEFYSGTLFTGRMLTQPFGETSKLDIECGISNGRALQDPSCMLQTLGSTSRFSYQLRAQRASIDFPGTMAGNRMVSAFTSVRLGSSVRLEQMTTAMRREIGNGADRSNLYSKVGLNYSTRVSGGNLYATVHGIRSQARYTLIEGTTERIENILRVTTGYHKRRIGLTVTGEQGSASADGLTGTSSLSRYRFNARYSALANLHLNGSMEMSQGNLSSTSADQTNRQYGLGATLSLRSNMQATVTGFKSTIRSHITQQYASLRAGVSKSFKSGRVLSVRAQFNENIGRQTLRTADYRIAFTTPLDVPFTGRRGGDDILEGRVVDAESGAPITEALLFLGNDLAITDDKGRFRFARPGQDLVFLRVDASSIGYDRTPAIPMPMEIGPDRFSGTEVVIPISQASVIRGVIEVYANAETGEQLMGANEDDMQLIGGHHGAVVQVESETIRQRTRTDRSGVFVFPQLPPGEYTVSVVRSNLPDRQQLNRSSLKVLLDPGGDTDISFRVIPAKKRIRMIKSSNLSLTPIGSLTPSDTPHKDSSDKKSNDILDSSSNGEESSDIPYNTGSDSDTKGSDQIETSSAANDRKRAVSTGWLNTLQQTARAQASAESDRDASVIPFYLEQGTHDPSPTHPAYPLLFVLCILFLLVDLDLLVRSLIEKRGNGIQLMKTPKWINTLRFLMLYGFAIVSATFAAGLLAGLAVSLALSGLSVAIESRTTYRAMFNITMLHFAAGIRTDSWVPYRQTVVQIVEMRLDSTCIRHLNGIEERVPTFGLHRHTSILGRSIDLEVADVEISFSRMSNLRQIRSLVEERLESMRPEGISSYLDIRFEDENAEWTSLIARIATVAGQNELSMLCEIVEAELIAAHIPTKRQRSTLVSVKKLDNISAEIDTDSTEGTSVKRSDQDAAGGSHLRLIKGGNHKAA